MESEKQPPEVKERLHSLDALRGFDMFWITGGSAVFVYLGHLTGQEWLVDQMDHPAWSGIRFFDLIFPLFMFIAGAAIPYAIGSKLEKNVPKRKMVVKALKRMIVLIALGIVYNGGLRGELSDVRYLSVLGQIGIAYFFAALIFIYTTTLRSKIFWITGILVGVAVAQLFIPVPGSGAGVLTPEGSMNGYLDRLLVPGRLSYGADGRMISGHGIYDALGLLSIVSAIAITVMGIVAGHYLKDRKRRPMQKVYLLAVIGAILLILSLIIHPFYPIIKKCWTSTYNLFAGGIGFMLIALFYWIIDVRKHQKWAFYFKVIGMNSIFVYLFVRLVDGWSIVDDVLGWTTVTFGDAVRIIPILGYLAFVWGVLYFMYRRKIFIRV
jgi:predicted acyltransferase